MRDGDAGAGSAREDRLSDERQPPACRPDPDDVDPFEGEGIEDSWEPPSPALGCPLQLLTALVAAVIAGAVLLGVLAALSWLVRGG